MVRKKELKLALGNVIVWIGVFFASVSVFNLFSDNLKLLISPLVERIVKLYQTLFHRPLEATGLRLSENVKNIISIYLLFGGIASRAVFPNTSWIASFLKNHKVVHNSRLREISLMTKPFAQSKILTFLFCLFLSPIVFYRIFQTPMFLVTTGVAYKDDKGQYKPVYELYSSKKKIPNEEDGFDARNILYIQLSAMLFLLTLLFIVNYLFL